MSVVGSKVFPGNFGAGGSRTFSLASQSLGFDSRGSTASLAVSWKLASTSLALDSDGIGNLQIGAQITHTLSSFSLALDSSNAIAALQPQRNLSSFALGLDSSGVAGLKLDTTQQLASTSLGLDSTGSTADLQVTKLHNLASASLGLDSTGSTGGELTATAFDPSQISGLALWLDAGAGVTTDGSNGVDEWQDQSGNGRNVTPFTATKPTYNSSNANFNSEPTIDFGDGDDGLSGLFKAIGRGNTNMTLITVARHVSINSTIPYLYEEFDSVNLGTTTIDNTLQLSNQAGDPPEFRFQNGDGLLGSNSPLNQNAAIIIVHAGTGYPGLAGLVLALNGDESKNNNSSWTGGSPTSPDTADSTMIGGNHFGSATRNMEGSIAEVLVYDKDLTTAELNNLANYLGDKYGITVTQIS